MMTHMNKRHVADARYAWKQQTPRQRAEFVGWLVDHGLAGALHDTGFRGRGGIVGEVTLYLPDTLPFSPADQREESKRLRGDFVNEVTKFSEAVQVASKYLGTMGLPRISPDRSRGLRPASIKEEDMEGFRPLLQRDEEAG
jgi:hypothetical protein